MNWVSLFGKETDNNNYHNRCTVIDLILSCASHCLKLFFLFAILACFFFSFSISMLAISHSFIRSWVLFGATVNINGTICPSAKSPLWSPAQLHLRQSGRTPHYTTCTEGAQVPLSFLLASLVRNAIQIEVVAAFSCYLATLSSCWAQVWYIF